MGPDDSATSSNHSVIAPLPKSRQPMSNSAIEEYLAAEFEFSHDASMLSVGVPSLVRPGTGAPSTEKSRWPFDLLIASSMQYQVNGVGAKLAAFPCGLTSGMFESESVF